MSQESTKQTFRPLPIESQQHLDRQRAYVATLVETYMPGQKLAKTKADFAIIQKVIDLKIIPKSNAWELQSLGVVFGDALASTVPGLAWSEVTDEYGTDPTLRYKQTSVQINVLTMISKRVEDGESVDISHMALWLQDFIKNKASEYR